LFAIWRSLIFIGGGTSRQNRSFLQRRAHKVAAVVNGGLVALTTNLTNKLATILSQHGAAAQIIEERHTAYNRQMVPLVHSTSLSNVAVNNATRKADYERYSKVFGVQNV
jgi:RNA-binding protein YhbY